jgi:serine/threonine protein kinase/formylglycine-generating enzyme required for sulfatase activity
MALMYCNACGNSNLDAAKFCNSCGLPLLKTLKAGTFLDSGRYEITEVLRPGGMSSLYIVSDHRLERTCVLKEMAPPGPEPRELDEFREKFRSEALILSRLSHPQLPRVFDYFEESDQCYMVMEHIDGEDLEALLFEGGHQGLPEDKVRNWAVSACRILEYLHSQTPVILHRDLKPSNMMIRRSDGLLFLIDFGLAKKVQSAFSHRTSWGTEGYAPIEQCQGSPEVRSDIYSLAASMHHLISGKAPLPFRFEPVRLRRPDVSCRMESILIKALQLNAADRFSSALELRLALQEHSSQMSGRKCAGASGIQRGAGISGQQKSAQDPRLQQNLRNQQSQQKTRSPGLQHNVQPALPPHKGRTAGTAIEVRTPVRALAIAPRHAVIPICSAQPGNGLNGAVPGIQQFTLKALYNDGNEEDVTSKATWWTASRAGTIDRNGKFTADMTMKYIQTAVVKARYGIDAEASITVGVVAFPSHASDSSGKADAGTARSFHIAQYTVTNREFCLFLNECGNRKEGRTRWWKSDTDAFNGIIDKGVDVRPRFAVKPGFEEYPVIYVSWYGAAAYSNWLSERKGLNSFYGGFHDRGLRRLQRIVVPTPHGGYRLPTSSEWDQVYRQGGAICQGFSYHWGDCTDDRLLCYRNAPRSAPGAPAGYGAARMISGLYDLTGRIWEWCNEGSEQGRVVRGRGWMINPSLCMSWSRYDTNPSNRFQFIGFRLAQAQSG